jgi:hypothetical protein
MNEQRSDFDTPWKDVLEFYFPEFIAFFFPEAHMHINWNRGYEFLDKDGQNWIRVLISSPS